MSDKKPRVSRTKEERIAEIDKKIAAHEANIATLKAKREAILNPKKRVTPNNKIKGIIAKAKETMTPEEIAEKLGISIEE